MLKKTCILLVLLATVSCSAKGAKFDTAAVKGNLVIYRPDSIINKPNDFAVTINGTPACALPNAGFYVTNIKAESKIYASQWNLPGTSTATVKPDQKVSYLKIETNENELAIAAAAVISSPFTTQADGPYTMELIDPIQAIAQLKDLRQACVK